MSKIFKKTILIDLDGVLNQYTGNFDKNFIPPIRKGAREFIEKLSETYEIKLFTTRDKTLALQWLVDNKISNFMLGATNIKEPCWLIIDDRCLKFEGDYTEILNNLNTFKPWYK